MALNKYRDLQIYRKNWNSIFKKKRKENFEEALSVIAKKKKCRLGYVRLNNRKVYEELA
jgi:hypothetical protein